MARTARDEGFDEIADWFETLAKAEKESRRKISRRRWTHSGNKPRRVLISLLAQLGASASSRPGLVSTLAGKMPALPVAITIVVLCEVIPPMHAKAVSTRPRTRTPSRGGTKISMTARKLDAEMRRVFDICHGCRRCFNLCDSFPRLFTLIDEGTTGELDSVEVGRFSGAGRRCVHAVRYVLHDEVPVCAAASVQSRFSPFDAALPRR